MIKSTNDMKSRTQSQPIVIKINQSRTPSSRRQKRFISATRKMKLSQNLDEINHPVNKRLIQKLALELSTKPTQATADLLNRIFDQLANKENFAKIREAIFFEIIDTQIRSCQSSLKNQKQDPCFEKLS